MGFQNKYVDSSLIKRYIDDNKSLKKLFKNETLIFEDKISSLVFELHSKGVSDIEIKEKIFLNNKN